MSKTAKAVEYFDEVGRAFRDDAKGFVSRLKMSWANGSLDSQTVEKVVDIGARSATWVEGGRSVFEVSPALVAALSMTDIDVMPAEMPLDVFLCVFPSSPIAYADVDGGRVPVVSALVVANGGKVTFETFTPGHPGSMFGWTQAGEKIADMEQVTIAPLDRRMGVKWTPADDMARVLILRTIANLAIYISERIERPPTTKRKIRGVSVKHRSFGGSIHLPQSFVQSVTDASVSDPAFRLRARFMVRGHWRNQACGKGRLERRKIWVRPHWKGPEAGEQMQRMYKAQTLKEAGLTND